MLNLTPKQELFVSEYLKDLNATQAAKRAGYSEKTARKIGQENLTKPDIAKAIEKAQAERLERNNIDADYVLNRLVEIDSLDILDIFDEYLTGIKPLSEWPKAWRTSLSGLDIQELFEHSGEVKELAGLVKKIKWPDKVKNLELLGKHINVQAFKERVETTGELKHNVMLVPSAGDVDNWEEHAQTQQADLLKQA